MFREGGGGAKKFTKHPKSSTRNVKNGGDLDGEKKKRRQDSHGSVGADQGYSESIKVRRKGSARRSGLIKNGRECASLVTLDHRFS